MRISENDYRALKGEPPKKAKYNNNRPTYYDPELKELLVFDSNKERDYYLILKDRQKRGEISGLERQVKIIIQPAFITDTGEKIQEIAYKADFIYYDLADEKEHIIDVKGSPKTLTEVYKLKKKLLAYKGIYIEEVY